jgi:predicted DNA-binding protein (MmcQ/YjbR family)
MSPEQIANYALSLAEVTEENPFGDGVDVYKVAGKIFAILSPESDPPTVSLKCEPELAVQLRAEHAAIGPGYHLNKKHWNTVVLDGSVPDTELADLVTHSYERVVMGMTKFDQARLLAR